ncbi:DUF4251 domain-containing protein [Dysgonomonas sp. 25]|uniref:DUF4251 domain-containing protein n=1 Tax=Dysgonomonas sp. 25 TaxID=2302933 RepID=UPI0013D7D86B|nr:DUF4251 domain-containing protein [Dysgonomonas sp. 25]
MKKKVFLIFLFTLSLLYGCNSQKSTVAKGESEASDELLYKQALFALEQKDFVVDINRMGDFTHKLSRYRTNEFYAGSFFLKKDDQYIKFSVDYNTNSERGNDNFYFEGHVTEFNKELDKKGNTKIKMKIKHVDKANSDITLEFTLYEDTNYCTGKIYNLASIASSFSGYLSPRDKA